MSNEFIELTSDNGKVLICVSSINWIDGNTINFNSTEKYAGYETTLTLEVKETYDEIKARLGLSQETDDLIPIDKVIDDMTISEDEVVRSAAEDYYLWNYAEPEHRERVLRKREIENRISTIATYLGIVGIIILIIIAASR